MIEVQLGRQQQQQDRLQVVYDVGGTTCKRLCVSGVVAVWVSMRRRRLHSCCLTAAQPAVMVMATASC